MESSRVLQNWLPLTHPDSTKGSHNCLGKLCPHPNCSRKSADAIRTPSLYSLGARACAFYDLVDKAQLGFEPEPNHKCSSYPCGICGKSWRIYTHLFSQIDGWNTFNCGTDSADAIQPIEGAVS